jgi:hypothetical protein
LVLLQADKRKTKRITITFVACELILDTFDIIV